MANQKDSELLWLLAVWVTEKWQVIAASFCRMTKLFLPQRLYNQFENITV
jgi:hypothetical protein